MANIQLLLQSQIVQVCFQDVFDVLYHGIKPVWKLTLHNGKTAEITKDHSVFCADAYQVGIEARPLDELGSSRIAAYG
jgi:hypothetical protein